MKLTFRFGKHVGRGRLSPEQQAVFERLELGEIDAAEAQRLLGGTVRVLDFAIEEVPADGAPAHEPPPPAPTEPATLSEEELARRLVERIAREVDEEEAG